MCQEIIHRCKYCKRDYICELADFLCPTINYDKDQLMCDTCRAHLEEGIKKNKIRDFEAWEEKEDDYKN